MARAGPVRYLGTVMTDLLVLLGQRVRERREALGLRVVDLARRLRLPEPRVAEVEAGRRWPRPKRLQAFAEALECTVGDLFSEVALQTLPPDGKD